MGSTVSAEGQSQRARQNVIFELGNFAGKLGRGRVCLFRKCNVEIPSDLFGIVYTEMDAAEGWKQALVKELRAAKIPFDATGWGSKWVFNPGERYAEADCPYPS
ncbi:nucleotide-binding protein [Agrobacterium fabrum]|uniref:nucleotide-binding protein n=1 Tax=Agrobacterium fabrum TaxID=1176649 RepID=UPI002157ECEF|nr:nucleotide-binding protein [Agrobacterium fabrum]MCR6727057.1 nucleotide-binding protein [Agrobacterium fabrum]MCX2876596.1 nucleotide-binding protein [Agrobacterium fabrum]WCK79531.1 nucleotide-binding protein [Agrobacterium fabrum]WEN03917.1 nucleotide-binding protein [Agrobacterium fabrum]WER19651.1 nucleotide-binding protein [Agrobacterium fabrum]